MSYDLKSIASTRRNDALAMLVVGPGKIGKTTFASRSENPIGILTEDGSGHIDTNAFPMARKMNDVYDAVQCLHEQKHNYKTLFVDSLDWLEPLIWAHVCERNNWKDIEAPGYGRGYAIAADEWRLLLKALDSLRHEKNMGVILICHDEVKRVEDPLSEGYDAHVIKLQRRAAGIVSEWADVIGFCSHEIGVKKVDAGFNRKTSKAVTSGTRALMVEPHPAHPGGNRLGLHDMELDAKIFLSRVAELRAPKNKETQK